jgi:DNA replication protein DnaC
VESDTEHGGYDVVCHCIKRKQLIDAESILDRGNGLTPGLHGLHDHPWDADWSDLARVQMDAALEFIANTTAIFNKTSQPTRVWFAQVGNTGNGKSHIAYHCVKVLSSHRIPARFMLFEDILGEIYEAVDASKRGDTGHESQGSIETRLAETYCLVLDDIQESDVKTEFARGVLNRLLSRRYNTALPTLINTNLNLAQLPERLGSRLEDAAVCSLIICDDDNRRPSTERWRS